MEVETSLKELAKETLESPGILGGFVQSLPRTIGIIPQVCVVHLIPQFPLRAVQGDLEHKSLFMEFFHPRRLQRLPCLPHPQ